MIHGPCGAAKPSAPCTNDEVCTKKYPKVFLTATQISSDGYPLYRRREDGRIIVKGRHVLDNRYVVPYNPYLCKVFGCHINVEICSSIQSVKYLYKYVYKGHDRIQARVAASDETSTSRDEPQRYLDARYVSASEAFWRICEFSLQKMYPSVYSLQIHDKNMQSVLHREDAPVDDLIERNSRTTLTEWMRYNAEHPEDELAQRTLYGDFPTHFTWHDKHRRWAPRQRLQCIGRVHFVSPRDVTRYHLRLLLHHVPGASSFEDLRTVDGVVYETYQRAAQVRGLLESDEEFDNDLALAAGSASPRQVRELFAMMLLFCEVTEPAVLLEKYMNALGEDFMHALGAAEMTDEVRQEVLSALESILYHNGSSLSNFPSLPQNVELPPTDNEWGPSQSNDVLPAIFDADRLRGMLNQEQRALYDAVIEAVEEGHAQTGPPTAKLFFVDGPGGSGKTFVYSAIIAQLKAARRQVIATATSGIAALLLDGGRTFHSTFKIPIPILHNSTCSFSPESKIGRQIQSASMIIVDEAPMMHRHVYEALDRSFRDVMKRVDPRLEHVPFGGKPVVWGGDFRQMLPVIPKGTRPAVIAATLNRSELWRVTQVFKLKTNVRVAVEHHAWGDYLLAIGEGSVDQDVPIPVGIRHVVSVEELIHEVYGDFRGANAAMTSKTILTPLNEDVVRVNDMVLEAFPGEVRSYRSADAIPPGEVDNVSLYPTEFLNTIDDATIPLHTLRLKIGCTVILLRNLNTTRGLCNGTRLRVDAFFPTMLQVKIVSQGSFYGDTHLLPRIALYPSQTRLPFRFKRLQFPVRLAFAMTINKAQGQTLDTVGFYLPKQLFAHGQLYVTLSRTRSGPAGIVFCDDGNNNGFITNVVYTEVFTP